MLQRPAGKPLQVGLHELWFFPELFGLLLIGANCNAVVWYSADEKVCCASAVHNLVGERTA